MIFLPMTEKRIVFIIRRRLCIFFQLYASRIGTNISDGTPLDWAYSQFPNNTSSTRRRPIKSSNLHQGASSMNWLIYDISYCRFWCKSLIFWDGVIAEGLLPDFIVERLTAIKRQQVKKIPDDDCSSDEPQNGLYSSMKLDACLEDEDENSDSSTSASNQGSAENRDKRRFEDEDREARRVAGNGLL